MSFMSVRKRRRVRLSPDEILFLRGSSGELGIVKAGKDRQIFIGTPKGEEIVQFLQAEDLIAVSAFSVGHKTEKGIKCMIHLLRELSSPIIVLPENHPTSNRLKMVVSCGDFIRLECNIQPGTHPEQDIICACEDLSGVEINAQPDGVDIEGDPDYRIEKLNI
jgi:hypothetical protein